MSITREAGPAFLQDGGQMGERMRKLDWSRSPLGHPDSWPQSLCAVVGLLLNSKFPMFVAWGPELGFLYNDSYAEILGEKHPQALGQRFEDIWAEIWPSIYPITRKALSGEATYHRDLPLTMRRKGFDEQTWFTFSYSPVRDESGDVAGLFCAVVETTSQVLAERLRVEELETLRQMFEQAPGLMAFLRGPQHVFELHNDSYRQLVGRDVTGLPIRQALPEVADQGFFELLDEVYKSGKAFVGHQTPVRLQREAGARLEERYINFIFQPMRDARGRVVGIFIEGNDVTDAIHANRALRESEERLRQLANTIPQQAWMADAHGRVHWYNDRWYEYTGVSRDQNRPPDWQSYFHPDDLPGLLACWQGALQSGDAYEYKGRMREAHGEYRTFYIRAAPLRDAGGGVVRWFGTNTDVTAIENAQMELTAANRRKDEFLAMLAHELRNPLAPISSAAELLRMGYADQKRVRQTSEIIARQVSHMTSLVDDLLDVSRVTRGLVNLQEEMLDVRQLVSAAVEQVQSLMEARHHSFSASTPDAPCYVRGDRTRLVQVFSNILNNAAKYTPPQGHVRLTVHAGPQQVEFMVEDDGIGIAPGLLPHIFELFTQAERSPDRSQGGLGLGLALVKSLVELQGGSVSASSGGVGRGSCFTVSLPRVWPEGQESAPPGEQGRNHENAARVIMVVDDNVDAALTLSMLLESTGNLVSVSHNAWDALENARRIRPAVLFVDIGLPDMDGYELARRLRAQPQTAHIMLVAVTGYGQPEDRKRALEAGFNQHLVKPVLLADLENVLAQAPR